MPAVDESDRRLIECLHALVFEDAECRAAIEAGLQQASQRFDDPQTTKSYSSVTLPIELFSKKLPEALRDKVRLARVFTIKAGQRAPHEEIHRNSIQRLVSFRGRGAVNCAQPPDVNKTGVKRTGVNQTGTDRTYRKYEISSPDFDRADPARASDISACWDVVPANTWHFPEARGNEQWFGVAFHSAAAEEIEDEYVGIGT